MRTYLSNDQKSELIRRYKNGQHVPQIAREMFIGKTSVYRYLELAGIKRRDRGEWRWRLTSTQRQQVVDLHDTGVSASEIARRLGCFRGTVAGELKRSGRSLRGRGALCKDISPDVGQRIVELNAANCSIERISKQTSLSRKNIVRYLKGQAIEPSRCINKRENHGSWKGGRILHSSGYIGVNLPPDDPLFEMCNGSYVFEHRLNMARYLGRPLHTWETVHHIDGNRQNNDITNLQLRIGKHGTGVCYRCSDCGSKRIEPFDIA